MSLLLGIINIAIWAAIMVLVGAVIVMIAKWFGYEIDWNVQRLYLLVVMLVVLGMIVALVVVGLPPQFRIVDTFRAEAVAGAAAAALPIGTAVDLQGMLT